MGSTVATPARSGHRVIPEIEREMLHASLRKAEIDDFQAQIGACLDYARRVQGWTLDELASQLPAPAGAEKRDPRQVQRWIEGKERCQLDVVWAVACLRAPFVLALARLTEDIEEETTLRMIYPRRRRL